MSIDLTGITNKNEYYTNHYFSTVFEENTSTTISNWNAAARDSEEIKTPWSLLRQNARQFYTAHDKFVRSAVNLQVLANIKALAGSYLKSLGYPEATPEVVSVDDSLSVPVYLEMTKSNGAPLLWVLLSASKESDAGIMESFVFNADDVDEVVGLMADVMCSTQSTVRIGGENIPLSQVQARFYRLDYSLMVYVFECLRRNTTQVRNIRAYLLTTLFNAPLTMNNHYQAEVQHDFGL